MASKPSLEATLHFLAHSHDLRLMILCTAIAQLHCIHPICNVQGLGDLSCQGVLKFSQHHTPEPLRFTFMLQVLMVLHETFVTFLVVQFSAGTGTN